LVAGNVYQYQHPEVIEIPSRQTAIIDSVMGVKQSTYATQKMISDSLNYQTYTEPLPKTNCPSFGSEPISELQ
jgi:hypothetical protein